MTVNNHLLAQVRREVQRHQHGSHVIAAGTLKHIQWLCATQALPCIGLCRFVYTGGKHAK